MSNASGQPGLSVGWDVSRGRIEAGDLSHDADAESVPDMVDARLCAVIAHRYAVAPHTPEGPAPETPPSEGWIWLPKARMGGSA